MTPMAQVHHHHQDRTAYYLEQLWTIGACGALGIVMVLLWGYNVLPVFLDPAFHKPVLAGGIALLVLVALRALALWRGAAAPGTAAHAHDDCDDDDDLSCDHEDCVDEHDQPHVHEPAAPADDAGETAANAGHTHGHDCGHDHGWAPWRYAVLLVPVVLFLMRLPWPDPPDPPEQPNVRPVKLTEAAEAADSPERRSRMTKDMETQLVRLKGKIETPWPGNRRFGFVKLRMTCCAADAYGEPVKLIVESPRPLKLEELRGRWAKVIGKVEFLPTPRGDGYVTLVKAETIKVLDAPPANQFDN